MCKKDPSCFFVASYFVKASPNHHQAESISVYYYYYGQDEKSLWYLYEKSMCKGFYDAFRTVVKTFVRPHLFIRKSNEKKLKKIQQNNFFKYTFMFFF